MNNTTASYSLFTAQKGTPGNPGASYLTLQSIAMGSGTNVVQGVAASGILDTVTMKAKSGFPFIQRPQDLTGSWQKGNSSFDPPTINSLLSKWNSTLNKRDTIAYIFYQPTISNYTWANFTIYYTYLSLANPDSCIIELRSGESNGSFLLIDNLAFYGSVIGVSESSADFNSIKVFPNPFTNKITLNLSEEFNYSNSSLEIFDNLGKQVFILKEIEQNKEIDLELLPTGIYHLKIKNDDSFKLFKVLKQ